MSRVVKLTLEYKDFMELSKFTETWKAGLSKANFQEAIMSGDIVQTVADFIADEIRESTNHDKFAVFMANRTYVVAVVTSRGVTFEVGGYSEKEMKKEFKYEGARISQNALDQKKDYNLWEMYEFHGKGITGVTLEQGQKGNAKAIVKDVGGVITVKKRSGESMDLKGRSGLISAIVSQLRPELAIRIGELIASSAALQIAAITKEAASKTKNLPSLTRVATAAVKKAARERDVDIAKMSNAGISTGVSSQGYIQTRSSSTGRFVKSSLHGVKISVKQ
jgi:hypothetical protein